MSNIKEQIRQEIERRIKSCDATSKTPNQLLWAELSALLPFIDSLPEDASCTYDTNELTPIPSVNIEDVARVQFASHAHVFDRKRKAVFDWEQFKEVAGIFYGFGKRDSQPEEKPSEDLNDEIKKFIEEYGYERGEDKLLIAIVARHFAEWQKEQMMKDAVETITVQGSLMEPEFVKQRVIFLKED